MKPYYSIREIASLYGLCSDTIRFYEEQGLIHPKRMENGYRRYTIREIGALNVIRNLRALDMPVADIRGHLENRCVASTLALYGEEERMIGERIEALKKQRADVRRMRKGLEKAHALPELAPRLVHLMPMRGFASKKKVIFDTDEDFLLRQLEQQHAGLLSRIGATMIGAVLSIEDVKRDVTNRSRAVFILSPDTGKVVIPGGSYASIAYRGPYDNNHQAFRLLFAFLEENNLEPVGDPRQIYHIDMHETEDEGEYLTEILLPVQTKGMDD